MLPLAPTRPAGIGQRRLHVLVAAVAVLLFRLFARQAANGTDHLAKSFFFFGGGG